MLKKQSLKNRIALFHSFSFILVLGLIFGLLYFVVEYGVNEVMIETLEEEVDSHVDFVLHEPVINRYVQEQEWEEIEHTDLALNPVFIAIYDQAFNLVEHSPNLVHNTLEWNSKQPEKTPYYATINSIDMLISQAKLIHHGEEVGYVVIGVSTKHNHLALKYLRTSLLIIFPIAVLLIFIVARYTTANAIKPVSKIIDTAQKITANNLGDRIPLPKNKDELFQLSTTINELLDRLEFQIIRAKQFSADASHELRTPLSIIKGTLEVLIRRERTKEEYQEKIHYTLQQVERLYHLVEQFLLVSRMENNSLVTTSTTFDLKEETRNSIARFQFLIDEKNIHIRDEALTSLSITNFREYIEIIIDNILSNAIKYTPVNGTITVLSYSKDDHYYLVVKNNGIGIQTEHLQELQERHFRVFGEEYQEVAGYGLGLNIATKLAQLSHVKIDIQSTKEKGTVVTLLFPKF